MSSYRKTTATARQIGIPPSVLLGWVRHGLIATPQRDDSGHYLWTETEIATARLVCDERRYRNQQLEPSTAT